MKKTLSMDKIQKEQLVLIILMVIAATITTLCLCNIVRRLDFTPATQDEWTYLYEQVAIFEESGIEQIYTTEDIKITYEGNSIKLESEQCVVILEVDNEHTLNEVEKYDKAYLNGDAIVLIIALAFADVTVSILFFFIEMLVLAIFLKWIQLWSNLAKKKHKE